MSETPLTTWARWKDTLLFRNALRAKFENDHARRFTVSDTGVVVGAETIFLQANTGRAALLVHGFNDTPQSLAYLAKALFRSGWTVLVPRLSGHGVRLPELALKSREQYWRADVEQAYAQLVKDYDEVFVCGLSMGGALTTLLAVDHPDIPALVLLAPYLGMPRRLRLQVALARIVQNITPYYASSGGERSIHDPVAKAQSLGPRVITARTMLELQSVARNAAAALPRLQVPVLYLQSREDNRIAVSDAERHFSEIGSLEKVQRWVTGCGHIITADYCRDAVAQQVIEWFARHGETASE